MTSVPAIVAIVAIVATAAAAQTASGFGFALLALPLLTVLVGAKAAVVGISLAGPLLSTLLVTRERGHVEARVATVVTVASLAGMPAGLWVITHAGDRALTLAIAALVLVFTGLLAVRARLPSGTGADLTAGLASGVLATSTGTSGPPIVLNYQGRRMDPSAFRATLAATFLAQGVVVIVAFALAGQITREAWRVAAASLPGLAIGWVVGQSVFARLSPARFRHVVLGMLLLSVALSVANVLTSP